MRYFKSHLSAFALAAATVTSAQAGPQEICLNQLLPNLIPDTAAPLASTSTIMGHKAAAYAIKSGDKPAIAVLNSHSNTALIYNIDPKALSAITTDIRIDQIGTLSLGSLTKSHEDASRGPDDAKSLFDNSKWAEKKDAFAACFTP